MSVNKLWKGTIKTNGKTFPLIFPKSAKIPTYMIRGGNPPFGRKMLPGIEQGRILYGDIPTLPTHTSHEFTPAFTSPNHTPHSHPRTTRHIHIPESHATFISPHSRPHYPRTHTPHYPRITHIHTPRITHALPTHYPRTLTPHYTRVWGRLAGV